MSTLEPHQQRVMDEFSELGGRLERLSAFMLAPTFDQLAREEQFRLVRQQQAMRAYYDALQDRITAFFGTLRATARAMMSGAVVVAIDGERNADGSRNQQVRYYSADRSTGGKE